MKPFYSLQILFFTIALILGEGSGWNGFSAFILGIVFSIINLSIELSDVFSQESEVKHG